MKVSKTTQKLIGAYDRYVIGCYKKTPLAIKRAKGAYFWDVDGKKYLDFFSGWAVTTVGHSHPELAKAIAKQAHELIYAPNSFYHAGQAELAEALVKSSFPAKAFFCNSGTEAIEGSIKFARLYGRGERHEIITFEKSFHGRTMGAMSATGQVKFHKDIQPILPGFTTVPFNDIAAFRNAVTKKTVAVLFEPIQGEGGIRVADPAFVKEIAKVCKEKDILLMLDEVQTCFGRTGKMFGYEHYGIKPDVIALAKSLGGGFPIGAFLVRKDVAEFLKPGTHGSTFGGNPLACAAALGVLKAMKKDKMLQAMQPKVKLLFDGLNKLKTEFSFIKEVRGKGFMAALELDQAADFVYRGCLSQGVLVNVTQERVVRLSPPLTVSPEDIRKALRVLHDVLSNHKQ